MFRLPLSRLEELRNRLQMRGQRRSSRWVIATDPNLADAVELVEEYGPICEILYLVMAADRRVLNVEREVMKGALDVISGGRVRTTHLEAMVDASARRVAELGESVCLERAIEFLKNDPLRAEITVVLAFAVALADGESPAEEQQLLEQLTAGLQMNETAALRLLDELSREAE